MLWGHRLDRDGPLRRPLRVPVEVGRPRHCHLVVSGPPGAARGLRLDQSRHRRRGRPGFRRRADGLGRRRDHQRRHRGRQQRVRLSPPPRPPDRGLVQDPEAQGEVDQGGQFHGERYDPTSRGQYEELHGETGVVVVERTDMEMRCDHDAGTHDLRVGQPLPPRPVPFTPIWCYRRNSERPALWRDPARPRPAGRRQHARGEGAAHPRDQQDLHGRGRRRRPRRFPRRDQPARRGHRLQNRQEDRGTMPTARWQSAMSS